MDYVGPILALEIHCSKVQTDGCLDILLAGLIELYRGLWSSTNFRLELTIREGRGGGGLDVTMGTMSGGVVLAPCLATAKVG